MSTIKLTMLRQLHLTAGAMIKRNKLPSRPKFLQEMEADIEEKFLHGGRGPGGQKINKCNSKVQLRHLPTGIVVECQETRSRDQNRRLARNKLALRIAQWENGGNPTARETALHDLERQGKRSRERKSRSKYEKHQQDREVSELQKLKEEEELLKTLLP